MGNRVSAPGMPVSRIDPAVSPCRVPSQRATLSDGDGGLRRALELDKTLSRAHASLGVVICFVWARKSQSAGWSMPSGSSPTVPAPISLTGSSRKGRTARRKLQGGFPGPRCRSGVPVRKSSGSTLTCYLPRYDDAIAEAHRALELDRDYASTYRHLGLLHAAKQMSRKATVACGTTLGWRRGCRCSERFRTHVRPVRQARGRRHHIGQTPCLVRTNFVDPCS